MNFMNLPHVGRMNVDTIVSVVAYPAKWHYAFARHVTRKWVFWGKPMRSRGTGLDVAWYERAQVRVWLTGNDYRFMECKPNEAERFAEDIRQVLFAARERGPERIVAAALLLPGTDTETRTIVSRPAPARHHHLLHEMAPYIGQAVHGTKQGFLTSTGRFVTRKEAMGIAVASGQVPPSKVQNPDLFSEDLW